MQDIQKIQRSYQDFTTKPKRRNIKLSISFFIVPQLQLYNLWSLQALVSCQEKLPYNKITVLFEVLTIRSDYHINNSCSPQSCRTVLSSNYMGNCQDFGLVCNAYFSKSLSTQLSYNYDFIYINKQQRLEYVNSMQYSFQELCFIGWISSNNKLNEQLE